MYLNLFHPHSKIKILKCTKYKKENCEGVKFMAAVNLKKNETINCLIGLCWTLTEEEEKNTRSHSSDVSIVFSELKKKLRLLFGLAYTILHIPES